MTKPTLPALPAFLPIAQICASPSNPRKHFDDSALKGLAESIKTHGVLQPILVRPNPISSGEGWQCLYQLVCGERRWRAAQLAGLTDIPAFWREITDEAALEIQVIENLQREDVHPLEEADGYQRLVSQFGHTAEQIGERIGKSRSYVYGRLKLTDLGTAGREAFFAGKLDASTALLVARIKGDALQRKAVKALTTEGYGGAPKSHRDAIYYIRNSFTISLKQATFNPADADLVPSAGPCSSCPQRSGNDPALFADIDDADVCTDVKCFEEKCQARRDQLLELAALRKIPVYVGDDAREVLDCGGGSKDDRYVNLDDYPDFGDERRTYREILGEHIPEIAALAERGTSESTKRLVELVTPSVLKLALDAVGYQAPSDDDEPEQQASRAKAQAAEAQRLAEREANAKAAEAQRLAEREANAKAVADENDYREDLAKTLLATASDIFRADPARALEAIRFYAIAKVRADADYGEHDCQLLERWGQPIPGGYDEVEEAEKFVTLIEGWQIADVIVFLLDAITSPERNVSGFRFEPETDRPTTLLALAAFLKTPTTPAQAAQAQGQGAADAAPAVEPAAPVVKPKKAKAKAKAEADRAPALPANEPAAPVETLAAEPAAPGDNPFTAPWPFPVES
jgi:ParB/RepB/Spo0J family partition protein